MREAEAQKVLIEQTEEKKLCFRSFSCEKNRNSQQSLTRKMIEETDRACLLQQEIWLKVIAEFNRLFHV